MGDKNGRVNLAHRSKTRIVCIGRDGMGEIHASKLSVSHLNWLDLERVTGKIGEPLTGLTRLILRRLHTFLPYYSRAPFSDDELF